MRFALSSFILLLSLAFVAIAAPVPEAAPEAEAGVELEKRGYSGRATWYDAGLGSCGWRNSGGEKVVALPSKFGKGKCGKWVTIKNNKTGKKVSAKVVDTCPGCGGGSLDLSKAAFKSIGNLDQGVLPISWSFS